jgi:hypothetical protein
METANYKYQVTREIPQSNQQLIEMKGKDEDHTKQDKHATARKTTSQEKERCTQMKPMPGLLKKLREF